MYYGLAKKAKELGLKVILKGNGGDEIFGGYPWQRQVNFFQIHFLILLLRINNFIFFI